jgi:hypothetical protein
VVLGAALRLWGLGANRLGYDEAFTAMAGRLPVGSLFPFLRAHDSHPPLDYLLRAPLARLGVSELVFRLPSALCSIAALALFAHWMRTRGRIGVLATAFMAVSAFEVLHGRNARMYAELELLGVGVAILADAWLRAPRRRHAPILAALVLIGLLTHVSMFLFAFGLLVLPGRRTDREAWRWRAAIAGAVAGWVLIWGSSFLVQAGGGHSDWIPRTTPSGIVDTLSKLATGQTAGAIVLFAAVVVGGVGLRARWPRLGTVWIACFAVPVALAALAGLAAPVLLDRTLTLGAWAPLLALAVVCDGLLARAPVLGAGAVAALLVLMVPTTFDVITRPTAVSHALRDLSASAQPGDTVAVRSAAKLPEIAWSLGVRPGEEWHSVVVPGVPHVAGIELGDHPASGRVWVLDWNSELQTVKGYDRCAPDRNFGVSRILCLRREPSGAGGLATHADSRSDRLVVARRRGTPVVHASSS